MTLIIGILIACLPAYIISNGHIVWGLATLIALLLLLGNSHDYDEKCLAERAQERMELRKIQGYED